MKKILIVLMLGLFFGIAPITLQASVGSNDTPVAELHGYTLNEVFYDVLHPLTEYIIQPDNTYTLNDLEWSDLADNSLKDVFESATVLPTNLITNGDFSLDSNSDGLADSWQIRGTSTASLSNGIQRVINSSNLDYIYIVQTPQLLATIGKTYYKFFGYFGTANIPSIASSYHDFGGIYNDFADNTYYNNQGFIGTATTTGQFRFVVTGTIDVIDCYFEVDNLKLYDVSALKTAGLFGSMSDGEIKTILDDYAVNGLTTANTPYFLNYSALGLGTITKAEIDFWYAIYDGSTTLSGIEDFGDHEYYFYTSGSIYDYSKLVADEIYSVYNNKLFSTLSPTEIGYQANKWESFDYINTDVLSMTDYLVYDEDGALADMLGWYQNYLDNIAAEELEIETISDNEKIILIITMILFIIGVVLAIYTKNRVLFMAAGLLFFVPIFIVDNLFIIIFSAIMILMMGVIAFYQPNKEGFES